MDICASGKNIWITNPKTHQVLVYEKEILETAKSVVGNTSFVNVRENYKLIRSFPDTTYGNDEYLNNPINISYRNGKIFVTDFGDFKIKIYSEDGKYLGAVGQYGNSLGQFARPKGIAIDKDENLFVVDAGFENVQIFNSQGKLLMFFGGPYKGPGDMWLPAKVLIDYENLKYYKKWVAQGYDLSYLIFVTNQYGPDKISVYGAIKPLHQGNVNGNEKN
jgi:DNA-binding beta-propeller fold protein YncE